MAKVRDERLCWLAVRDQLARHSRTRPTTLLRRLLGNLMPTRRGLGADVTGGSVRGRMARYSIAVHEVAQRLDPGERQVLRDTGQVPDWFLPAVRRRAGQLRRRPTYQPETTVR
jgi:hypothetical protein